MEIGIFNKEVNQIESTTKLFSSVVLDDHSYCWQKGTTKCVACADQKRHYWSTGKGDKWTDIRK